MAMLAEPRRKQKWTLNPRGKEWSDDSSKFGQKMLEKMGWTSGKGLGANEQGMTEHVRVKLKNDQSGIGYSISNQDKLWTEQQESFDMLLKKLQGTNDSPATENSTEKEKELSGKSLELKSKRSRARVHYQKFTRGKDVNKYSTKDLANIFGKKDLDECVKVEKTKDDGKSDESQVNISKIGSTDTAGGILTIMGGTMGDYFKNKMPIALMSDKKIKNNEPSESESDDGGERRMGFGFSQGKTKVPKKTTLETNNYSFINPALDLNNSDDTPRKRKGELNLETSLSNNENVFDGNQQIPKKRKILNNFVFENSALDLAYPERLSSVKKIKNEMEVTRAVNCVINDGDDDNDNDCREEVGVVGIFKNSQKNVVGHENNALDLTDEVNGKKRVTFNDKIEYSTDLDEAKQKKKKKKKDKKNKDFNKLDKFEIELDESAKKKLKNVCITPEKNSFVNEALDVEVINEELFDNEANERKSKKTKRKKIRPALNLDTIKEEDDAAMQVDNNNKSIDCSTSGKKRLRQDKSMADVNLEVSTAIDEPIQVLTAKVHKKKKKKTKEMEINGEMSPEQEVGNENENKVNFIDSSQDDSQIKDKKEGKEKKKNRDKRRKKESEHEVINEVSSDEANKKSDNYINCINDEVSEKKLENSKTSKPKKMFKALFAQSPIVHFMGSNINELRGYGVE